MRTAIFFGGQSREREVAFAGGRTVYDNLNKALFEPVPVFVDSLGNFILLDWQYIYKGTIRDFYPPARFLPASPHHFQVYIESLNTTDPEAIDQIAQSVGRKIAPHEFKDLFDFAFLALHGPYGEDGAIQGLLEWYDIPYSGAGIFSSATGINKATQKQLMQTAGFSSPPYLTVEKNAWATGNRQALLREVKEKTGTPFVIKPAHQGSSIGVSILHEATTEHFAEAMDRAFFIRHIDKATWTDFSDNQKVQYLRTLTDLREGIGLPVVLHDEVIRHPEALLKQLDKHFTQHETATLESVDSEETVLIEGFISGKEFSCIVVENEDGTPLALPPTEIRKGSEVYDYRSKYLPGMSRKITPIDLPEAQINTIIAACEKLYSALHFDVYARIDGFITDQGKVFLNDPNTTSGMMPSSFFFHQAAEIGLDPSQFLTYIIRTSLKARIRSGKNNRQAKKLLQLLDKTIDAARAEDTTRTRVGVIMGGYSSERHISVESGRNIYEKLASSTKYTAMPLFLTGDASGYQLYTLPVNFLLKDNADDIKDKVLSWKPGNQHPVVKTILKKAEAITKKYSGSSLEGPRAITIATLAKDVDAVFIALHGRPGEDGTIQQDLEQHKIPYNGSGSNSSSVTINKYETNRILREQGIQVADHLLVQKKDWQDNPTAFFEAIEAQFTYPFITKPADDGCSSAVKKIHNREELSAFSDLIFRDTELLHDVATQTLRIKSNEEFSRKDCFLVETLIGKGDAVHFLEITGGLLTHWKDGRPEIEVFEPSEALAGGEILSLEEKFLAGEGQNITPARYTTDPSRHDAISRQVRNELKRVAEILRIEGYARIDAFVRIYEDNRAETIIIEVNSLPGMTPATCIFHQCALNGYTPYDFIDAILTFGMERNKHKQLSNA